MCVFLYTMDVRPTISCLNIHKDIFNNGLQSSMQDKKKVAFKFVLNLFEFDENNIDIH